MTELQYIGIVQGLVGAICAGLLWYAIIDGMRG